MADIGTKAFFVVATKDEETGRLMALPPPPHLKINLIYPCTSQHIQKYSSQRQRMVTETPEIYRDYVRPFMKRKREAGRLNWVYNILEGRTEQEDVVYRHHHGPRSGGVAGGYEDNDKGTDDE